jgi:signal transduction histidine kinase
MTEILIADDHATGRGGPRTILEARRMTTSGLRWPVWADIPLAAGVFLLGLVELALDGQQLVSVGSVAVMTLPVAFRRPAPLAAAAVSAIGFHVDHALGGEYGAPLTPLLATLLLTYTLAAHAPPRRAMAGIALTLASLELGVLLAGQTNYGFLALCLVLPAVAGASVRRYRALSGELTMLAARLERERGASERLAVAEERRRIARDLHDAIAHAVSRMVVQAAGAEQVLATAPDRARVALIAVQDTGRDAIDELRQTLRILLTDDQPTPPPHGNRPEVSDAAKAPWRTISWPWWADILLAVAVVGVGDAVELWHGSRTLILVAVGAAVAIALRRRHPLAALALAVTVQVALLAAGYEDLLVSAFVAVLVVLYTVVLHGPPRRARLATAVAVAVVGTAFVAAGRPDILASIAVWTAAVWAAGLAEGAARRQAQRLQDVAVRLARERDARTRLAVIEERVRIARELHDSVAHTVSVMVLQAGAAEQVLASSPAKALAAARAVEAKGRDALHELHELLGVLRDDEDTSPRAPQPGLTDLDTLIAHVARTGLPVELHVRGEAASLPAGVGVSVYRIIQEALTNTLKHAGPVQTTVTLDYTPDALIVEILDDGDRIRQRPAESTGHGLIGMRERVALYHGDLQTGPRAQSGYQVRARLPLSHATP